MRAVLENMMSDMRYLVFPLGAILFALLFAGTALAAEEGRVCTMEYAPVCAAKQVQCVRAPCYPVYQTYGNSCTAANDDAAVIHQGECTATETGPVKPAEPYVPPKGCIAWFDGCNSCSVSANGAAMCTMRACYPYQTQPGHCTAYEKPAPTPSPSPAPSDSVSPPTSGGVAATTSVPESMPGLIERIWNWLRGLIRF
jgi:hypothetical protein